MAKYKETIEFGYEVLKLRRNSLENFIIKISMPHNSTRLGEFIDFEIYIQNQDQSSREINYQLYLPESLKLLVLKKKKIK